MAIEFVLDDKGNPQKDAETGLYLMKRNDKTEPLDLEKLFQGIAESNRDAAAKRKALESVTADLADAKAALEAMKDEVAKMKASGGDKKDGAPPQESEEMRKIKALEERLQKAEQEKKDMAERTERRESSQTLKAELDKSKFASEHHHIPKDMLMAYFAPQAYQEIYGSPASYEEFDGKKQWVFRGADGEIIMSEKRFGRPADFHEAAPIICASRPEPGDIKLFPAPNGGSGAQQPQRNFANSNPWAKGKENITMQHQIMAEDPALAQRLAASAGVQLPAL